MPKLAERAKTRTLRGGGRRFRFSRREYGFSGAKGGSLCPKNLSPKFYSAVGCFVVTLPNLNGSQESSQESSQETELSDLSAGARKAYALIAEDKKITAAMIAKRLGVSSRMVFKYISDLRRIVLRHVGSTKGGHWEVIV